ncbi:DUF4031 domain-containing protein [Kineococcus sp. LSe6-4]|uniref:DUF4031 domain-containing protein n=1 Tax=Kineococcus halophytocola TaxID=3234027 RepID=A0ABV4H287_9ACTN
MTVLIDAARVPAHGTWWSHLASDTSADELHAFARRLGVPPRAFEGDHYDVPADRVPEALALGAELVTTRELLARVRAAGLRTPKRRGEKVVRTGVVDGRRVDVVRARHVPAPHGTHRLVRVEAGRLVLAADGDLPVLPGLTPAHAAAVAGFRRRWSRSSRGVRVEHDGLVVLAAPQGPLPPAWWAPLLRDP